MMTMSDSESDVQLDEALSDLEGGHVTASSSTPDSSTGSRRSSSWVDTDRLFFFHEVLVRSLTEPAHASDLLFPETGVAIASYGARNPQPELDGLKVESTASNTNTYDLSIQNLSYKVKIRRRGKPVEEKVLLNNITAQARHGEVLAIMGPSGASKSTLLDAIAGRISRRSMSGSVLVNGQRMTDKFKRISGYVMQDDAHFPMLTARETLMFSARLRLPRCINIEEKKRRVETILELLGLKGCADTKIGNEEIGGVSGGERRRISIALDLIHDPEVLFLDEPTSGLDSTSALQVMQSLSKLAKERSRTIILTIHQPSYRILDSIDNCLVLAKGNVVYHGHHTDIVKFFSKMGFVKPENVTTVEYMMDKIEEYHGDLKELILQSQPMSVTVQQLTSALQFEQRHNRPLSSTDYKEAVDTAIPCPSVDHPEAADDVQPDKDDAPLQRKVSFANSMWEETWVLSDRNTKNTLRTRTLFLSRIGVIMITSLIMATLFFKSDRDEEGLRQRQVFFVFTIAILVFTSTEAMPVFLMERGIFIRETSRGAYRASSYVLSYSLVVVPFMLFLAVLATVSSYFAIGLVGKPSAIFYFGLVMFMVLCISNAFVACISGLAPNFIVGLIIFGASSAYMFLFSGFFVLRSNIPKYWWWMHYASFFKYPYEALLVNELGNIRGHVWFRGMTSEDLLSVFECKRDSRHQWLNIVYMICFYVGYRFIFYLTLRFQTKNIRR